MKLSRLLVRGGRVFMTAVVSLNVPRPESGLFADFVERLKNDTCFDGLNEEEHQFE